MSNEAGSSPSNYEPNEEVDRLLKRPGQPEIDPEREQLLVDLMDRKTSWIVALNSIKEIISREWQSVESTLDRPQLEVFYHFLQRQISLATNTRQCYGKTLDRERHGGEIDLSNEKWDQRELIAYELGLLEEEALDEDTKHLLAETLTRLRGQ